MNKQLRKKDVPKLREKILKKQGGVCWICKRIPKIACLDHHHSKKVKGSGKIRGVLCSSCNIFIAKSENNCVRYGIKQDTLPYILRRVADYLEKKQYPYIHPSEAPKPLKLQRNSFNKLKKAFIKKYPKRKIPEYPKSGKLIKSLEKLYKEFNIEPKYLKK